MHRRDILEKGLEITTSNRNKEYGEPKDNMANIAELWSAYLRRKYNLEVEITGEDVAWLNTLQKVARTFLGKVKPDTYIDAAAYAAIAGEVTNK